MKSMIRHLLLLTCMIMISVLSGCSADTRIVKDKINVVTSFYPLYDFAEKIGGGHANVINLVPAGVEPHEWTPKSKDILDTSQAQLFLYNGAGFEGWVDDFLTGAKGQSDLVVLEASEGIDLIQTRDSGKNSADPHTWVSPVSAMIMAENIKDGFVRVDPDHREDYEANYSLLNESLQKLHERYKSALSADQLRTNQMVVTHHAFGYLCRDYGLKQIAIMGLAPDAEPTSKDILRVSKFVKENDVKYIFYEELVSDKLAKTLAEQLNVNTLVLNPLEGLTEKEQQAGEDYITIMDRNLQNILKAIAK